MSDNRSVAEQFSTLPEEERAELMGDIDPKQLMYSPEFWLRPNQLRGFHSEAWVTVALAGRGYGKEIHNKTPVPTPSGWTTMGELRVGDEVYDEQGGVCKVEAIFDDPAPKSAYRMSFSDGTSLVASGEHQWVTWTHRDRKQYLRRTKATDFPKDWASFEGNLYDSHMNVTGTFGPKIRTTDDIITTRTHSTRNDNNHCIPTAQPLFGREKILPIDPWVLGFWLGDGDTASSALTVGVKDGYADEEFVMSMLRSAGIDFSHREIFDRGISRIYMLGLQPVLRVIGVLGDKHVPSSYMRASARQRLALLRGLMDSDGHAHHSSNQVEFVSTKKQLASAVLELARSLSEKPVLSEGRATLNGEDMGPKWRVTWRPSLHNPFALDRKAKRIDMSGGAQALRNRHRMITDITPHPIVPMRCITVDSPNSMYLVGEAMIPTHNTRLLSEWVKSKAEKVPGTRISLVARTVADVRDTMVQGDSGILSVHSADTRPEYIPSVRKLTWPNGSIAMTYSADSPSQLRGPSFHYSACDELAAWKHIPDDSGATAWDHVQIGTRLGSTPQIFAATTPKRVKIIRELVALAKNTSNGVDVYTGSTMENATNLPPEYIEQLVRMYEGTALEQQELYGILLDFVEGALWRDSDLEPKQPLPKEGKFLKVISVDPGVTSGGDATGVVVCYGSTERKAQDRKGWVVDDLTEEGLAPEEWANNVVTAHHNHKGSVVVVEGNQGGDLVRTVLHQIDPSVPVITVHASKSKAARAEPVVIAYRMDRVKHVQEFVDLEDELTGWEPGSKWSPNRLDAMVHGLRAILIDDTELNSFGRIRSSVHRYNQTKIILPDHMKRHAPMGGWRDRHGR